MFRNGKSLIIPPILDFINYVDHAEFVITDSFHATAFSINMNTKPICIYPNNYSNRLSEFLKMVDCESCHVKDYNDFSVINNSIDFNKTNEILEKERIKANSFISRIKKDMETKNEK